jgi:dTMP kinase
VGTELVEQLSLIATGGIVPDLTFFLDLDPLQVYARTDLLHDQEGKRESPSRFDQESEQFHRRLRTTFLALAQTYPERIKVIDASQTPQVMHQQIICLLHHLLHTGGETGTLKGDEAEPQGR